MSRIYSVAGSEGASPAGAGMLSPPEDVLDDVATLVDTVPANGWISPAAFAETPSAHVAFAEAPMAANDTAAATRWAGTLAHAVEETGVVCVGRRCEGLVGGCVYW